MSKGRGAAGLMSMTGFAATGGELDGWAWTADIRSVNGRGLDLRLRVPDWVDGLEATLRKMFQARLARGNVTLNLKVQRAEASGQARLNTTELTAVFGTLSKIHDAAVTSGFTLAAPTSGDIAGMRGVLDFSDTADESRVVALKVALIDSVSECLSSFVADRAREGAATSDILAGQIEGIKVLIAEAREAAGDRDAATRAGMERALARLMDATEVPNEARMLQELALIAVKSDVSEELDRLASHVEAAKALMASDKAVGRKFDFLMQEFNREANTLCSKSQATELTAVGLDLKAVIDQMREQVQNIE